MSCVLISLIACISFMILMMVNVELSTLILPSVLKESKTVPGTIFIKIAQELLKNKDWLILKQTMLAQKKQFGNKKLQTSPSI